MKLSLNVTPDTYISAAEYRLIADLFDGVIYRDRSRVRQLLANVTIQQLIKNNVVEIVGFCNV